MVARLNRSSTIEKVCPKKLLMKLKSTAKLSGRTTSRLRTGLSTWSAFRKVKVKSKNATKSMK